MFNAAMKNQPLPPGPAYGSGATTATAAAAASGTGSSAYGNATGAVEMEAVPTSSSGGNETSVEIVNPGDNSSAPAGNAAAPAPAAGAENGAAAGEGSGGVAPAGNAAPAAAPANPGAEYGLKPVGPPADANTALPPIDKPAAAPDQINDVKPGSQPAQVQTGTTKGKAKNVPVDKSKESSSKKKKKGLDKLNPF